MLKVFSVLTFHWRTKGSYFILTTQTRSFVPPAPSRGVSTLSRRTDHTLKHVIAPRSCAASNCCSGGGEALHDFHLRVLGISTGDLYTARRTKHLWQCFSLPAFFSVPKHAICPAIITVSSFSLFRLIDFIYICIYTQYNIFLLR